MCWQPETYSLSIKASNNDTAGKTISYYSDVIMVAMASQITSRQTVCSTACPGPDQRKHQSCAFVAFVRGIHWWPVNSPHKGPVTRKMFPFVDVIMSCIFLVTYFLQVSVNIEYVYANQMTSFKVAAEIWNLELTITREQFFFSVLF